MQAAVIVGDSQSHAAELQFAIGVCGVFRVVERGW